MSGSKACLLMTIPIVIMAVIIIHPLTSKKAKGQFFSFLCCDALGVFQEKAVEDKAEEEYKDSRRFQYLVYPVLCCAEPAAYADTQDVGSGNKPYSTGGYEKRISRYSECHCCLGNLLQN